MLADIRVPPQIGNDPGPDAVLADNAYAVGTTRKMLPRSGIKGTNGGRPPALDSQMYRARKAVED